MIVAKERNDYYDGVKRKKTRKKRVSDEKDKIL